ncbi:LLM class flavin-dependent oxidoreductase [Bacillus licheniformis]|nr:LLM class flavin-dependent oxidoreductase [Bacillus licheniformis]
MSFSTYGGRFKGETVSYSGKHLKTETGACFPARPTASSANLFGGSSKAGQETAAKHADVYLTWGEPPHLVKEKSNLSKEG